MPRDCGGGLPDEKGPLLRRSIHTFIQAIKALENLESLDLNGWIEMAEEKGRPWILLEVLPHLFCIPRLEAERHPIGWQRPLSNLFPLLNKIAERKGILIAADVQALGREAKEEVDHPLSKLAEYLQEPDLLAKIAERWNQRYSNQQPYV